MLHLIWPYPRELGANHPNVKARPHHDRMLLQDHLASPTDSAASSAPTPVGAMATELGVAASAPPRCVPKPILPAAFDQPGFPALKPPDPFNPFMVHMRTSLVRQSGHGTISVSTIGTS